MKFYLGRFFTCAAALLIASTAFGQTQVPNSFQAGQPARATEVNANFSELESAANQNTADIATNASDLAALETSTQADIDANTSSVTDLESDAEYDHARMFHHQQDIDLILNRMMNCGEYKVYGCTQSVSGAPAPTTYDHNWFQGGIRNIIYMRDASAQVVADSLFFAIPIAIDPQTGEFDFTNLYIGGSSNITRTLNPIWGAVLVDDCDNPTVELVPTGEPASSRLVVNSGNYYRYMGGPLISTVDVTGLTYGLINPQTPGDIVESCTLVTDQTGLYDSYAIDLKFNVLTDGFHNGPWTHQ